MFEIRQSTTITISMGPAVDKTDGVTPKTALSPTVKVSKNGGSFATRNSATATSHDLKGFYKVELDTTDTGTLGRLRAEFSDEATHLPVWEDFMVLTAAAWDDKYVTEVALQAATGTTATLDSGASGVDNYYADDQLLIVSGTGVGQCRRITGYVGSTKVATVTPAWATNPVAGSTFRIVSDSPSSLTVSERDSVADALLDRSNGIATGLTPRSALKVATAAAGGKISGATGLAGTIVVRNAVADSKNVITATVDANGNRTAVAYDLS